MCIANVVWHGGAIGTAGHCHWTSDLEVTHWFDFPSFHGHAVTLYKSFTHKAQLSSSSIIDTSQGQ